MSNLHKTGLLLNGRFLGYMQRDGRNQQSGEPWVMHFIGVETPKDNGFPGETIVHQLQVPRDLVNNGFLQSLKNFENQDVTCSVYVRAYPSRGAAAYSLNLTNSLDAVQIVPKSSQSAKVA